MDFGLGLILSFTDKATAGINSAVNSLNTLTNTAQQTSVGLDSLGANQALLGTSMIADQIGNSFMNAGSKMTGLFTGLLSNVRSVGQEFENFDVTLTALYGGAEQGAKKSKKALDKLFEFATKSPLEVTDVKDMLVTLQSQGINAFEETTGAITNTKKEYLSFVTDLAAFKPEVPMQRFKMALQNYIGSGEKKMMRTVFDMGDIEDIIGHGVSDTAEGRMQDIVELVEKKGLTGLSEQMSKTWQGVASNVSDAWTRLYYTISQNDVFASLKNSFVTFAKVLTEMPYDDIDALGKTIADALNFIVKPLEKMVTKVAGAVKSLIGLAKTRPQLMKFGLIITILAGGFLLFAGVIMKVIGSFSGFVYILNTLSGSTALMGGIMSSAVGSIMSAVLPLIAIIGGVYAIWKTDFGGIRTLITDFANNMHSSWKTALDTVNGSSDGIRQKIDELRQSGSFWDNLTVGIMEVAGAFKLIGEAWSDNTLSEDSFVKMQELGIQPLVEAVLDLKYRFEQFKNGFSSGVQEISNNLKGFLGSLSAGAEGTFLESAVNSLTDFLQKITSGDAQAWYDFGESFAKFLGKAIAFGVALKGVKKAFEIGGAVSKFGSTVGKTLGGVKDSADLARVGIYTFASDSVNNVKNVGTHLSDLGTKVSNIGPKITGLKTKFSELGGVSGILGKVQGGFSKLFGFIAANPVIVVIGLIIGALVLLYTQSEDFRNAVHDLLGTLAESFGPVISMLKDTLLKTIEQLAPVFQDVVNKILPILSQLASSFAPIIVMIANVIGNLIGQLAPVIVEIATTVIGIIQQIAPVIAQIITCILQVASVVVPIIAQIISLVANIIAIIITNLIPVIKTIMTVVSVVIGFIMSAIATVLPIIMSIVSVVTKVISGIISVVMPIVSFIINLVTTIITTVVSIISGIINFVKGIWEAIKAVFSVVVGWFKGIFGGAVNGIKSAFNGIVGFFKGIWSKITGVFSKIGDFFGDVVVAPAKKAINWLLDKAIGFINGFIGGINGAIGIINKIPGVEITKIEKLDVPQLATGGVVDKPMLAEIGENGPEAVVPLKNNIEWINGLAVKIATLMNSSSVANGAMMKTMVTSISSVITGSMNRLAVIISTALTTIIGVMKANVSKSRTSTVSATPVSSSAVTNRTSNIINNTKSDNRKTITIDDKVIFNKDAIQITIEKASDEEIDGIVDKVIKKVKRSKQISDMTKYKDVKA